MKLLQGKKYLWVLPEYDTTQVLKLAASYNLSLAVIQTALARGFTKKKELDAYFFGSEGIVMHPSLLKDAQKAVDRIVQAIDRQEKILIFGDYDVDGITAAAMMMHSLLLLGADVNFFLPHRVHDGYGLSVKTVQKAAGSGYSLIITVDNGIAAFDAALEAKKHGIDLIITDHHKTHEVLPEAYAIVNPHQADCSYPYKELAGVGVAFKLCTLLYEQMHVPLSSKMYELLLLGTIADVVPLTGENRFWVRYGLRHINQHESYPLTVLKRNACAAGLTVKQENLSALKQALEELITKQLSDFDLQQKIIFEAEVKLSELTKKFLGDIALLEPFGAKNEQPLFYIRNVSLVQSPMILKNVHVKCMIFADGIIKPLIFFNRPDLIEPLFKLGNEPFDVAAYVSENYWNGRTNIELTGVDIAYCKSC